MPKKVGDYVSPASVMRDRWAREAAEAAKKEAAKKAPKRRAQKTRLPLTIREDKTGDEGEDK